MFANRREELQSKKRERSIPESGGLPMAPQPAKLRTPNQAEEPPDHRDSRNGAKKQFENHRGFQSMGWQHPKALLTCTGLEWPASARDISLWPFGCSGCSTIPNPPATQCVEVLDR